MSPEFSLALPRWPEPQKTLDTRFPDCFSCPDLTQHKLTTVKGSIYFSKIMCQQIIFTMCETVKSTKLPGGLMFQGWSQSSVQISLGKSLRAKRARAFQNLPWKMQIFGSDLPPWVSVKPGTGQVHYLVIRDVECKVLSKTPKIVMVHVYHYPHEGSDLDDIAVLVLWGGGGGRWGGAGVTAR